MSVASEDYPQDLEDLEERIASKTKLMQSMLRNTESSVLNEVVAKKSSHNNDVVYPRYDNKLSYYQEFWKVYLLNEILISQIKESAVFNKDFTKVVAEIEELQQEWTRVTALRSKTRVRRTSDMIEKKFECPFEDCDKKFGTDVSLNLHMKLKHNSGTKSEREALAREICLAEERGEKFQTHLNFPPGYLEFFRKNFKAGIKK